VWIDRRVKPRWAGSATKRHGLVAWLWRLVVVHAELAKLRLTMLVVATTAAGYLLASSRPVPVAHLAITLLGTGLVAGAANGLNQWLEVARDRRMARTPGRPLADRRIGPVHAVAGAIVLGVLGAAILYRAVNPLSAAMAGAAAGVYLLLYTPLKTRSGFNLLIGAVVGAIPPMLGWAAAAGCLAPGAWALGAVLFVWQIPHSLALGWLYREQYARGGFRVLPVLDPDGRTTAAVSLLYAMALLPSTVALTLIGTAGWMYGIGAVLLACWLVGVSVQLCRRRCDEAARRLFIASVVYLPLLLVIMVADRGPIAWGIFL